MNPTPKTMTEIRDIEAEKYAGWSDYVPELKYSSSTLKTDLLNLEKAFKAGFDCRDKLDNEDVTYDPEKLQADAQNFIDSFRVKMKHISEEILGEIYVNVGPYVETDQWTNYRESLRIELEHEYKYSKFKSEWATNFRRAVFVENREEISNLISDDILKRIKHLEDCKQEFEQFRYTPLGDTYQDLKNKNTRIDEALKVAIEALEFYSVLRHPFQMGKANEALAKIRELRG
jgi:hypothetical protein